MKKSIFLSLIAVFLLFTKPAKASISGTLLPAIPDSVWWTSASLQTNVSGSSGAYSHYYKWRVVGDTTWSLRAMTPHSGSPLKKILDFMTAGDSLEVCSVLVDGSYTFVTNIIRFRMKPLPHAAYISGITYTSSPSMTTGTFFFDLSVITRFYIAYNAYSDSSDMLIVGPGTGTGSLHITSPNVPGTTYSTNILVAEPVVSGIVADTNVTFPNFTVPAWISPDVSGITFSSITQDSFKFSASIMKGNASSASIRGYDLDSTGSIVSIWGPITIYSDTAIMRTRLGLPNENDGEKIVVTSLGGSDSVTAYQRMLQVSMPQIISFDTVGATTTSTNLIVRVKTNGHSYWSTSTADVWVRWTDKDGNIFTTSPQTVAGSTATNTLTFTGLTNLKLNPTVNTATIYIQNIAGLIDSVMITYVAKEQGPAVPISVGWYIESINSFQIGVSSINTTPTTGDPYDLFAFVNIQGSALVDTSLLRPGQVGPTSFSREDTIQPVLGGFTYEVRLATRTFDGRWSISNMLHILTIPPAYPTFSISDGYSAMVTSIGVEVRGCMNGTPSYLDIQVYPPDMITPVYTHSFGYQGTGYFEKIWTIPGLDTCTDYVVSALTHDGSYGNQIVHNLIVKTLCPEIIDTTTTGIHEMDLVSLNVFPNPTIDQITISGEQSLGDIEIYSMDGKIIFSQSVSVNEITIPVVDFANGMYVIKGENFTKKFIKQ